MNHFISPIQEGNHKPWTYVLTFFLVISGMEGFGRLPLRIALSNKGVSAEEVDKITMEDLMTIFTPNEIFIYSIVPFFVGFGMLLLAFRLIHKRSILSFLTIRPTFDLKRFFVGFAVCAVLFGGLFVVQLFQADNHLQWNFKPDQFLFLAVICLFLVPFQTGLEEVLFRGYVMQLLGRATSKGLLIIVVNGLLFGALHLGNPEVVEIGWIVMLFYVLSGVFASLITLMDDGLELSWGFHTANNFMSFLIVTSDWYVFRTDALYIDKSEPGFGWEMYLTIFGLYPLMIVIFARLYKWTDWKRRLFGESRSVGKSSEA